MDAAWLCRTPHGCSLRLASARTGPGIWCPAGLIFPGQVGGHSRHGRCLPTGGSFSMEHSEPVEAVGQAGAALRAGGVRSRCVAQQRPHP